MTKLQPPLPTPGPDERRRLLTELLRGVSRAFYLTLRVLPGSLREPIGLAYLLARAADTIADTRRVPPDERLGHLLAFRAQVAGPAQMDVLKTIAAALTEQPCVPQERALLHALPQSFALLEAQPAADRTRIRKVVITLTQGMEFDLRTFPCEDSGGLAALKTQDDLDRYTYYVAGCVGAFWTEITAAHTPALRGWNVEDWSQTGIRFGKALQYTNVLRDLPRDLRMGRCYLPEDLLVQHGLQPGELTDAANGSRARAALGAEIQVALEHFEHACMYILATPRRCVRLRLATLWPVLMGLGTLRKLAANEHWLDPQRPSKVSRAWVYTMLLASLPVVCSNLLVGLWTSCLLKRLRKTIAQKNKARS